LFSLGCDFSDVLLDPSPSGGAKTVRHQWRWRSDEVDQLAFIYALRDTKPRVLLVVDDGERLGATVHLRLKIDRLEVDGAHERRQLGKDFLHLALFRFDPFAQFTRGRLAFLSLRTLLVLVLLVDFFGFARGSVHRCETVGVFVDLSQ